MLNKRIREARLRRGITLANVAEQLGVSEGTVQRYESGNIKNIKHETIQKLAEILRVSPSYLVGWEKSTTSPNEDTKEFIVGGGAIDDKQNTLRKIGGRIREMRVKLGMSQAELAEKCGYTSRTTINKIEKGVNDIPRSRIVAISDALGISVSYLMGCEEPAASLSDDTRAVTIMKMSSTQKRLNNIMMSRKLKQVDILKLLEPLCAKYGVNFNKSDLSQYVSGKTEPNQDKLFILSKALGVSPSYLMGWEETTTNPSDGAKDFIIRERAFSKRLRYMLDLKQMKQAELVEKTGIGKSSISTYLSGEYEPKQQNIYKIAKALDVTVSYLMGWEEPITNPNDNTKALIEGYIPVRVGGAKVPILGNVAAGVPIETIEDVEGYITINDRLAAKGKYFALRVKGESMVPELNENDIVVVRQQPTIESGEIAVVLVNGQDATVKRVQLEKHGLTLIGTNLSVYSPKYYSEKDVEGLPITIIGKVVQMFREM